MAAVVGIFVGEFLWALYWVTEARLSHPWLLFGLPLAGAAIDIAVGDGALGFWKALDEVFPGTRHQRCWLHKTANLLNKVPKSVQGVMKADIREISMAPTQGRGRGGHRGLRREVRGEVSEGRRVPDPGP